jgi:LuxR family maltose regulon positive regulatory protein
MLRRGRLHELLDGDGTAALAMINAPIGYGKTTLLRSWCIERPEAVAWITLDEADDDPVRLWTHVATAVERLARGIGNEALMSLAVRDAPIETAVDELMNGLVVYGEPLSIVLDDLHAVKSEDSLHSIGHAIERLPANARVFASTRSDPAIGLARLRARGVLTEIRARELAFTLEEASELMLREGIVLSRESVELLADRTEGWPAGLYLAALWLRGLENHDDGVRAFAGSTRHLADYLADEVLAALEPRTRDFLVQSAALGRFTPEMCDAVLDWEDSADMLAELSHSNLFLVPLDAIGAWYRYHHLFGELLQLELGRDEETELRRRAATWCRGHGLVEEALEHAAAAGDIETVAEMLVENHLDFIRGGRIAQFLLWVRRIPLDLLLRYPLLPAVGADAAALLTRPEVESMRLLAVAERAHAERPQLWTPYLEAVVEVTHAMLIERGDVGAAVEHGRRAVAAARAGADALSVGVLASLAQALFFAGDLAELRRTVLEAVERPDAPDVPDGYVGSLGLLALLDAEEGRNESAEAAARQAISFAQARSQAGLFTTSPAHLALALALTNMGSLEEAEREAIRGEYLRRAPQPTVAHAHALLVLAQVRTARLRLRVAAKDLARAQRAIAEFPDPGRLPAIAATVEQGLAAARAQFGNGHVVEQPSAAELAVLRCLATGLSRREIGQQLYISLNTVKTHTRQLYRKLGATSRKDAVAHAEALDLIDSGESPG